MAAISKNVYFDVLDYIVNKRNNTVHRAIETKPIDLTTDSYAEYNKDFNKKILNLKLVTKLEFQNRIKNTASWTYVINDLDGEETNGSFYEKELQKTSQEKFRIEKLLKRKGDKLYVKCKGYDNRFNSSMDKKTLNEIF